MKQFFKLTLLLASVAAATYSAQATSFTPVAFNLNTGVSATTGLQLPGGAPEERYSVSGVGGNSATVIPVGPFPNDGTTWTPNAPAPTGGQWIGPSQDYGITHYSITFSLLSLQTLNGFFTGDNPARLVLDGNVQITQPGWPAPNWQDFQTWDYLTPFSLSLPAGTHTVTFDVFNGGGPSGLIVDTDTLFGHVPDGGSTCALLGMGLMGVGFLRRKLQSV